MAITAEEKRGLAGVARRLQQVAKMLERYGKPDLAEQANEVARLARRKVRR